MTLPRKEGLPSIERLREVFSYDPETGLLYRRLKGHVRMKPTGSVARKGYLLVSVDDQRFFAHRVMWAMHHGEWPENYIDHINCDTSDNRIVNLRPATKAQNNHNRGKTARNTSGYKGVYWNKVAQRWFSIGNVGGKRKYLGLYDKPEDASEAYQAFMRIKAGEFNKDE